MARKRKQKHDQQEEMQVDIAGEIEVLPTPVHNREGQPAPNAHPPEVVAAVLEALLSGKTMAEIHRETGISWWSLRRIWAQYGQIVDQIKNRHLAEKLEEKAQRLIQMVDNPEKLEKVGLRDLGIVLGILLDKRQDLLGRKPEQKREVNLKIGWKSAEGEEFVFQAGAANS